MPADNVKSLRRRIRSVQNTRKITKAMQMVSAAKLRRNQQAMAATRPFLRKLEEVLGRLAQSPVAQSHPLFEVREKGEKVLVLFTADRGLCGAFNSALIKAASRALKADPELKVFTVGRKGRDFVKKHFPERHIGEMVDLGGSIKGPVAEKLGNELLAMFQSGAARSINILGPEFVSTTVNRPRESRFLPVEASQFGSSSNASATAAAQVDYLLEPSPEAVFNAVLPRYLKGKVFLGFAESFTCEHSSRMLAMNNATKNCTELVKTLTLRANKMRQANITREIIEIVSGAEALK
jgi:F-type H+-transporting ATPase subunit gamma